MSLRHLKYFLFLFAGLFFLAGSPVEFGQETSFFHGFLIPNPTISIGLENNVGDVLIRSSSGMKVYGVHTGYDLVADDVAEVRVRGDREKLTEKFVLLITQAGDPAEAEAAAAALRAKFRGRVYVEEVGEGELGSAFQVRVGDFLTRGDALAAMKTLDGLGWPDVWILRDILTVEESRPRWILIENELRALDRDAVLYFIPSHPQSFLVYNGRGYRGIFVLKATPRGTALVNIVNVEDYLKGVVPGELSPDQFGELEALKAQAVAARTYAMKNMGQFRNRGYDLTDTPQSQVYRGMSIERPLSSRAVEETAGEVATYKGKLINALYTSTCGGRTEDAENVFAGDPVPYLKSVECVYEKQREWTIEDGAVLPAVPAGGRDATTEVAALLSLGVIPAGTSAASLGEEMDFAEAVAWIRRVLGMLGRPAEAFVPAAAPLSFISFARLIVDAFGWQDRLDHLLLPSEVDFILRDFPHIAKGDRERLAFAIQSGYFPYFPRTENPGRPPTRAEAALCLYKVFDGIRMPYEEGEFRSAGEGAIEVSLSPERKTLRLAPGAFLLRSYGGAETMATRLTLLGGEKVRWLEVDGIVRLFQAVYPQASSSLDRSSRFNRWQVRKAREEMRDAVNQYHPVGELLDLAVRKRGASGRVTELLVLGTEGRTTLRGLRVRWALGLRDTLFTIDREYDDEGRPLHFVFTGRGWGHGVGLCQVGAYGMALAGASYRDILQKYYRGVKIDKAY